MPAPVVSGGVEPRVRVRSPGAVAVRLGVLARGLPPAARLSVAAANAGPSVVVTGAERLSEEGPGAESLGGRGGADVAWLPTVVGDTVDLVVTLPPGGSAEGVEIGLPLLAHFVALPLIDEVDCAERPALDDRWETARRASVALLTTDGDGRSYRCSGVLVVLAAEQTCG